MDVMEHQLTTTIDGVECPVSPTTDASTVNTKYGDLNQVLDEQMPVKLTYQEYMRRVQSGEITDQDKTYYHIIGDDVNGIGISDSTVSRNTTFSSKKILELISNQGGSLPGSSGSNMIIHTKVIEPSNWSSESPSAASFTISGISNESLVMVSLSNKLNGEDYSKQSEVVNAAKISRIKHIDNTLILYAYGVTPTIPIQLEISIIN